MLEWVTALAQELPHIGHPHSGQWYEPLTYNIVHYRVLSTGGYCTHTLQTCQAHRHGVQHGGPAQGVLLQDDLPCPEISASYRIPENIVLDRQAWPSLANQPAIDVISDQTEPRILCSVESSYLVHHVFGLLCDTVTQLLCDTVM